VSHPTLVCKKCGKEVSQFRLDEAVYYLYDANSKTLEMDLACECGSKLYKVKIIESQEDMVLWPK
jgi:DNA-directed RNA polymerase subunit RPC12/RpoP